jgi:hypothetical protein
MPSRTSLLAGTSSRTTDKLRWVILITAPGDNRAVLLMPMRLDLATDCLFNWHIRRTWRVKAVTQTDEGRIMVGDKIELFWSE